MAITNFIPEIWADETIDRWENEVVFPYLVSRKYEGIARKGNVVKLTGVISPTVRDYKAAGRLPLRPCRTLALNCSSTRRSPLTSSLMTSTQPRLRATCPTGPTLLVTHSPPTVTPSLVRCSLRTEPFSRELLPRRPLATLHGT